jgi:hypothetical protein
MSNMSNIRMFNIWWKYKLWSHQATFSVLKSFLSLCTIATNHTTLRPVGAYEARTSVVIAFKYERSRNMAILQIFEVGFQSKRSRLSNISGTAIQLQKLAPRTSLGLQADSMVNMRVRVCGHGLQWVLWQYLTIFSNRGMIFPPQFSLTSEPNIMNAALRNSRVRLMERTDNNASLKRKFLPEVMNN